MLLSSCESLGLDDTLQIVQDYKEDKTLNQEGLDAVVANKAEEEAEAAKEAEAEAADESSPEMDTSAIEPNDSEADEEASQVIDGKVTTPATESIRYSLAANESVGELVENAANYIGSVASSALGELASLLRTLGIKYGPVLFRAVKTTVIYVLIKTAKAIVKIGSLSKKAVYNYQTSMSRHVAQIEALKQTCLTLDEQSATLPDNTKRCEDYSINQWSLVDGRCSFVNANARIITWLNDSFQFMEKSIIHDIDQTVRFLNSTKNTAPVFPVEFIQASPYKATFREQRVVGYEVRSPFVTSYVYPHNLPNKTILMALLPSNKAVVEAARTKSLDSIKEAYQSSGIFLTVGQDKEPAQLFNNYMNPKQLIALLDGLTEIAKLGYQKTRFYKQINTRLPSLTSGFQQYLNWLQSDQEERRVADTYAEFVAMKQSFIAKTYIPAAMDSHDYLSTYLTNAKRFVRENIKVLSANIPNSAE